jgi:hypothetical protein
MKWIVGFAPDLGIPSATGMPNEAIKAQRLPPLLLLLLLLLLHVARTANGLTM